MAGANPGLVMASSFSLVGRVFGWVFLLCCIPFFLLMSEAVTTWIAGDANVWQATTVGYLFVGLIALLGVGKGLCRTVFDVCVSSARGDKTPSVHPKSGGLIYGVVTAIVVGTVAILPLALLAMANGVTVGSDADYYTRLWESFSATDSISLTIALCFCSLWFVAYVPMGFLTAAVAETINPLAVFRWLWHCSGGYVGTLIVFKLWSGVIAAMLAGFLALVAYGTYTTIDNYWPDATEQIFQSHAFNAEFDDRESLANAPVDQRNELRESALVILRDEFREKAVGIQKREIPVKATLVLFAGVFVALVGISFFIFHGIFTLARMLGLVARRYESQLRWLNPAPTS